MDSTRMTNAGREARNRYNREWSAANREKRAAKLAAEKGARDATADENH